MDDLTLARQAAAAAAAAVIPRFGRQFTTDYKGQIDPVTTADREAEAAITQLITRHRPHDGVVAEEGGSSAGSNDRHWVIDPLDGTVNFLHGVPQVAISIALTDGDGTAVGVIRDVFRDEEFIAVRGQGATRNGEEVAVSHCEGLDRALVSTGFAYDRHERADEYTRHVAAVMRRVQGIRRNGSAALDLAWVACGRFDAHWEFNLSPWDVAAGFLLVTEAGGSVLGFDGPADHKGFAAGSLAIATAVRDLVDGVR